MKRCVKNSLLLVVIAALALVFAGPIKAQMFSTLHNFSPVSDFAPYTNSDGALPSSLIMSGQTLYGSARNGGAAGLGALFALRIDGTGFTNIHDFVGTDGARDAALVLSSNILYGASYVGGSFGRGSVFAIGVDGTGLTDLFNFPRPLRVNHSQTVMALIPPAWFYLEILCTARRSTAVVRVRAQSSPSKPMGQVLPICTVLLGIRQTEPIRTVD